MVKRISMLIVSVLIALVWMYWFWGNAVDLKNQFTDLSSLSSNGVSSVAQIESCQEIEDGGDYQLLFDGHEAAFSIDRPCDALDSIYVRYVPDSPEIARVTQSSSFVSLFWEEPLGHFLIQVFFTLVCLMFAAVFVIMIFFPALLSGNSEN